VVSEPIRPDDLAEIVNEMLGELKTQGRIDMYDLYDDDENQSSWSVRYSNGEGSVIRVWLDAATLVRRERDLW
jgi:hypothetical protein